MTPKKLHLDATGVVHVWTHTDSHSIGTNHTKPQNWRGNMNKFSSVIKKLLVTDTYWERKNKFPLIECHRMYQSESRAGFMTRNSWLHKAESFLREWEFFVLFRNFLYCWIFLFVFLFAVFKRKKGQSIKLGYREVGRLLEGLGKKKRMLFEIISGKNLNKNKTATATKETYLLHLYSISITTFPISDFHFFLLWFILHEISTGIFARLIEIHAMAIIKACIVRFVYFDPDLF